MSRLDSDDLAVREPELASGAADRRRLAGYGVLAVSIMMPVTLPVPVLGGLVSERFEVSELLTSLFMSINMIGALVWAPIAGAAADRWQIERRLFIGALLIDSTCFFLMATPIPFSVFLAIRFVEGCAHISALSILLMLASRALPGAQRGRAMGVVGGCMMLGVALGAPLGGFLGQTNALIPLFVGGGLTLGGAGLGAILVQGASRSEARPSFRDIVRTLAEDAALFVPLAFAFTDRFTVGFFTTTFSLYLRRIHDAPPAQIGITIALFMIPFALLSYPFGRLAERRSISLLLCVGSVLYGLGTVGVGFVEPPVLQGLMIGIGAAAAVMFVPSMVMTSQIATDEIRATAMGAFNAAGSLGFIMGPLVGGAISELVAARHDWLTGYRAAFVFAGAAEIACVALALPFLMRLRREGRSS